MGSRRTPVLGVGGTRYGCECKRESLVRGGDVLPFYVGFAVRPRLEQHRMVVELWNHV